MPVRAGSHSGGRSAGSYLKASLIGGVSVLALVASMTALPGEAAAQSTDTCLTDVTVTKNDEMTLETAGHKHTFSGETDEAGRHNHTRGGLDVFTIIPNPFGPDIQIEQPLTSILGNTGADGEHTHTFSGETGTATDTVTINAGTFVTAVQGFDAGASTNGAPGAFACGPNASASGVNANAFGTNASAQGTGSFAAGAFAEANGFGATANGAFSDAVGAFSTASGFNALAVGTGATATGAGAFAFGPDATATGATAVAVGPAATATGADAFAVGVGATATGADSAADGPFATASGYAAEADGFGATATGTFSDAFGAFSTASGYDALAVGTGATATGADAAAVGPFATASGYAAEADGPGATAVGAYSDADAFGTAVGFNAGAAPGAVAVGVNASANAPGATAVGPGAQANAAGSAAYGAGAVANQVGEQVFGNAGEVWQGGNTYTMGGITSDSSKDRQSGRLQLLTTDAYGHLASDGGAVFGAIARAQAGIAIGIAMEAPSLTAQENFGIRLGYGNFDGDANAMGLSAMGVMCRNCFNEGDRIALDLGVGLGWSDFQGYDSRTVGAVRAGVQWTWK